MVTRLTRELPDLNVVLDHKIFAGHTPRDREMLLRATAEHWYGIG